jgi:hypothetical protein
MEFAPGRKLLRLTGILYVLLAIFGILLAVILFIVAISPANPGQDTAYRILSGTYSAILFMWSVFHVAIGGRGNLHSANIEKAAELKRFGMIDIGFIVLAPIVCAIVHAAALWNYLANPVTSLLVLVIVYGLLIAVFRLPIAILYIIGAKKNLGEHRFKQTRSWDQNVCSGAESAEVQVAPGRRFLLVVGIIYICLGGLFLLTGGGNIAAFNAIAADVGGASPWGRILWDFSSVFGRAMALFQIFIGIMGIINRENLGKASLLRTFGVVDIVLIVFSLVATGVTLVAITGMSPQVFGMVLPSLLPMFIIFIAFSLPLPILYIVGAQKNLVAHKKYTIINNHTERN